MTCQDDLLCAFARKDVGIVEGLATLREKSHVQDGTQGREWWMIRITAITYEFLGGGHPLGLTEASLITDSAMSAVVGPRRSRMRDSHYLVPQLVQASGFLDVLSISTMVDAGLVLFERSPSYKKFGMNTVDALGRAGHSLHPQGPFAGSDDGWEGPAIMQHSNHYNYYDNYDRHVNRIEDLIHCRLEMAIREDEDYDSDSSDISTHIVPDGEPGENVQYHLDHDECAFQSILGWTPDREIINPHSMLHHIAWFWGRQRPGYTRPAGHGYHIGDDNMSWDDDDDDIDSDEDLFGNEGEM